MNTAKNANQEIQNGIRKYEMELQEVNGILKAEWEKDCPDQKLISACISEANDIRNIMHGLKLADSITFRHAMTQREFDHESV